MHQCSPGESLVGATFMHPADPSGVYQRHRIGMMHECSPGKLFARAELMHHVDNEHGALMHYAALKGLMIDYTGNNTVHLYTTTSGA